MKDLGRGPIGSDLPQIQLDSFIFNITDMSLSLSPSLLVSDLSEWDLWPENHRKDGNSIQNLDGEQCREINQVPNLLRCSPPSVCLSSGRGNQKRARVGLCLHPLSEHWVELQTQIHAGSLIKSDTHLYLASFKDFACTPPPPRYGSAPSAPACLITKQWSGK